REDRPGAAERIGQGEPVGELELAQHREVAGALHGRFLARETDSLPNSAWSRDAGDPTAPSLLQERREPRALAFVGAAGAASFSPRPGQSRGRGSRRSYTIAWMAATSRSRTSPLPAPCPHRAGWSRPTPPPLGARCRRG